MAPALHQLGGDYLANGVIRTRSRRSQPSLNTRPYPSRPALASGSFCKSDNDRSSSPVFVKMEPHQGAGNDGNGGGGGGGGMFSDYSYLPATEFPHSSPGSGGGHHNSQQSASLSSSSSSSSCSSPALGCGTTIAATVSITTATPAATSAFKPDMIFIQTQQIPTQLGVVTMAPDNTQLPSAGDFNLILDQYIKNLSPKKQQKALISSEQLANIAAVLSDPKSTTIQSPQFRYWAKKMFQLVPDSKCVIHNTKPVAVRENLYQVLTTAHFEVQHGGRDKTLSRVRECYSW